MLVATTVATFTLAQSVGGGFKSFWGAQYTPLTSPSARPETQTVMQAAPLQNGTSMAEAERRRRPAPFDLRTRVVHWNRIAIDASGVDHTPVAPGENRVFGEQLGPGRASRAMAIVHMAIFDAMNAIFDEWQSYTRLPPASPGVSADAAIAQAAHDTLANLFPSQAASFGNALDEDLGRIRDQGKEAGRVRRHAQSLRAATPLQPDCPDRRRSDGIGRLRIDSLARPGERGDGRRGDRNLGIEVLLPVLASYHRHPRSR
jgi:hypothetical protein